MHLVPLLLRLILILTQYCSIRCNSDDFQQLRVKKYKIYTESLKIDLLMRSIFHTETCMETVPEVITAFLERDSFEEIIR